MNHELGAGHTCRCACGGLIAAERGLEAEAVAEHNRTARHEHWRAMGGCWPRLVDVDAAARANWAMRELFGWAAA